MKDDDRQWRCPPGEAYAKSLGLYYRLRTDTEIDWVLQNNLRFLEDYFRGAFCTVEAKQQALITTLVAEKSGITLAELFDQGCQPDNIYTLLAQQKLQIDLHYASLSQNPELVEVFSDTHQEKIEEQLLKSHQNPEILFVPKIGQKLLWNGCQLEIINPGQTQTALKTGATRKSWFLIRAIALFKILHKNSSMR